MVPSKPNSKNASRKKAWQPGWDRMSRAWHLTWVQHLWEVPRNSVIKIVNDLMQYLKNKKFIFKTHDKQNITI